jgi:hypothetical protein
MTPHWKKPRYVKMYREELCVLLTTTEAVPKTCVPGQIKLMQKPSLAAKSFRTK